MVTLECSYCSVREFEARRGEILNLFAKIKYDQLLRADTSGDGQPSSSQSVKGVRQGISIPLDGLSPIPARKTPQYLRGNPLFYCFFCAASCCVLRASTRAPAQHSSSSSAAEADIDTEQPVGRNMRPPWMPFWGWGNVLPRSQVSFCSASSM